MNDITTPDNNEPATMTPDDARELMLGCMPSVEAVRELESVILQCPQVDMPTEHIIHAGVSARTVFIPAGTVLTGALTNLDNICVVFGDITVTTDDGPTRLTGFNVLPAKSGVKRAGVTHADTWWCTLHRTEQASVEDVEDEMTNEAWGLLTRGDKQLEKLNALAALEDKS